MKAALIIVDVQNDFCPPDGALMVPEGDQVVPVINKVAKKFETIVTTQDWHPENHHSFEQQGGPWPPHCVQGSPGAEFHKELDIQSTHRVLVGATPENEGYSAFDESDLENWLRDKGIDTLFITGLATDYCVKASVLDARKHNFATYVISDACRAVDVNPGDGERAFAEMKNSSASLIESKDVDQVLASAE